MSAYALQLRASAAGRARNVAARFTEIAGAIEKPCGCVNDVGPFFEGIDREIEALKRELRTALANENPRLTDAEKEARGL